MAGKEEEGVAEEFVYRISTAEEWEELQKSGSTYGGDLDKKSGFIHLSKLNQSTLQTFFASPEMVQCVRPILENFCSNTEKDLYLLQVDSKKLGDGLIYEAVDVVVGGSNVFPHFYGPSRSFSPLPLDAVTKAEKITMSGGLFSCSLLD
ncbi:uncharacterized protein LOC131154827 isoform X2 [Malania oleifera]|uniref:uncharacterized protein LOC131154827 isoform X2 n=1 Tax=Malania oleifera TaxID=397392 RepID=UPI0025ADED31|nr:uncharacterized protein LOC131154827 isoform X2 [Malania oleifera]